MRVPLSLFAYVLLVVATLLAAPLVLGKIPPNRFYGFRTPKISEVWYPAKLRLGLVVDRRQRPGDLFQLRLVVVASGVAASGLGFGDGMRERYLRSSRL